MTLCPICQNDPHTNTLKLQQLPDGTKDLVQDPTRRGWCPKHGKVDRGTEYRHQMEKML